MPGHNAAFKNHDSQREISDPGASGTITCDRSNAIVNLVSTAAQARTLALPTREGDIIAIHFRTDAGDVTLTVASAYNEVGSTTLVFSEVGQFAVFMSFMNSSGVFFWRLISNSNLGNNAVVAQGAALTAQLTTITHTAPGTPDYAVQDLINSNAYGFAAKDEGNSVLAVVANLQVRMAEVEARLEAAGIVAAN